MDRLIGIDYGKARTGIAVSDPLKMFATALDTVHSTKIIDYIKNYALKERIVGFVVGLPMNLNNEEASATKDVKSFIDLLRKNFPDVDIHIEDERFTSVLAQRAILDGGAKLADRRDKSLVDKVSAAIILQSYLDRINYSSSSSVLDNYAVKDIPYSVKNSRIRTKKRK